MLSKKFQSPIRSCFEELLEFVPHIDAFLRGQDIRNYSIYLVDQVDGLRFNRASLINSGFDYSHRHDNCDYIAIHDVDLLPMNPMLSYSYPADGPMHLSPAGLHPMYNFTHFFGGVLLMRSDHFILVNGMSNNYWGWGLEDDEFLRRVWDAGLTIGTPNGVTTGPQDTFKHIHVAKQRPRDKKKCYNQLDLTRHRDRMTGLNTTTYDLLSPVRQMHIEGGGPVFVLQVKLHCDMKRTPYCDCSRVHSTKMQTLPKHINKNINIRDE